MSGAVLVQGNALALPFADESVDLVVTSCPYWAHRDYGVEGQIGLELQYLGFIEALLEVMAELARVLKPRGSIFWNQGDRSAGSGGYNNSGIGGEGRGPASYIRSSGQGVPDQSRMLLPHRFAAAVTDRLGLKLRAPIIWWKNAIPQNAPDRVEIRHEDVFHFTKTTPAFSNPDVIAAWESVWRISTEPTVWPPELGVEHDATFPQEIPRRCILGWTEPGMVVLDPFGGSGTTAMVARAHGRFGVSLDLSADYLRLARWRVFQSGHAHKALDRTKRDAQTDIFTAAMEASA